MHIYLETKENHVVPGRELRTTLWTSILKTQTRSYWVTWNNRVDQTWQPTVNFYANNGHGVKG